MENFCAYCSILLPSEADFQQHCTSESHQLMIMSDEGREWKFRAPARGVPADQYIKCGTFALNGKCRFGQQCCDAHGDEELNEWKERYDYRQTKLQHAKEINLQGTSSYTEQLLEKWVSTPNPLNVMKEKIENVDINIEPETNLTIAEKNCGREWIMRISTKNPLRHVALLYETHRSHFRISEILCEQGPNTYKEMTLGPQCQELNIAEGTDFAGRFYTCKIRFATSIYGTFRQAVVFDFGYEPVLIQKLSVDVVSISDMEKLQQMRENMVTFAERWSSDEVVIVPFEKRPYSYGENEKSLLACYPAPESSKFTISQAVMEPVLTKENYSVRLHELLYIEEMAQYELLSRYNVQAHLNLSKCYLLTPNSAATAKYAHDSQLFANMTLSSVLSEDSSSGRLILTNCNSVLIASAKSKGDRPRKVYEALIEDKGKTVIYIRLSKQCTEDLNLKEDQELQAEVQFQLNRLPLCEMHFSVDRLLPPSSVFPNISVLPSVNWNTESAFAKNLDARLNSKQKEAVLAITTPISVKLPPVLIIGPFGTGKTFTLACAVKNLLEDPNSRILVCTHSNSAADIYIREYLHPLVAEGNSRAAPLRIYFIHRWVATVHPTVLQYCLVTHVGCDRTFDMPTVENVMKHKVVVTTLSTSRYLVQLGLDKGFFTHILIDEAAQAMECEAITPLSLANENTRVVLAGDHMQLSPEVHSQFAQERNLHTSLLERLYDLYPEKFVCKILLCENYRSHEAIIQYTSELFYDNHLIASAKQPQHEKYYPLTFFTARGEDVQDVNSTAYHNNAEVYEIVERVIELKKSWPEIWGEQDETSIGVVTPYYDQVVRIRAELRKKKLHGVSVERVLNVQGKQFRVIFLSAVRTRQTCNGAKTESDLDHGFLSNARLLNTAITRAQSLVAVVGDPVSLCSVGKCRKLWEKFIHTCHKENSLFGITWDSLRSHLDSIELKKTFILNPLAPEFVPGRMFHGQSSIPTSSNEMLCMAPTTPPWLVIPLPQPAPPPPPFHDQPPIMQNPMTHVPPMPQVVPPQSFNLGINCVPSPVMAQHPPFAPFPTPHTLQQTALQARMSSGMYPRRAMAQQQQQQPQRMLMDSQIKEFDRGNVGRPIKRNNAFPVVNGAYKPLMRGLDDRIQPEDSRRMITRNEMQGSINTMSDQMDSVQASFQNNMFYANDKMTKPNVMKLEDHIGHMKPLQPEMNVNNFNGLPESNILEFGGINGTRFSFHQKPVMDPEVSSMSGDMGFVQNSDNFHLQQMMNNQQFHSNEVNNSASKRDRAIAAALDEFLLPNSNQQSFPVVDRWPSNVDNMRLEMIQSTLQEKLSVLEKILPLGSDLKSFVESQDMYKQIFSHFLANDGPLVAKRFLHLVTSIKQDYEMLMRLQMSNLGFQRQERKETMNNVPRNVLDMSPLSFRTQNNSLGAHRSHQVEMNNGYDPFRFESPLVMNRFATENSKLVCNGEGKNGYVRMPSNYPNIMKSRDTSHDMFTNGPNVEKSQEQLLFEMRNMSLNPKPSPSSEGNFLQSETLNEALRRAELERQFRENQKDMWSPVLRQMKPAMDMAQESYLNKLRNISSSASSTASPVQTYEQVSNSPAKRQSAPGHMTALSVSYPDIPDILPSHIHPQLSNTATAKEPDPTKAIQKPTQGLSDVQRPSPYVFDFPISQPPPPPPQQQQPPPQQPPQRSNIPTSQPFTHVPSEGMTYAKILRSPHP